MLNVLRLQNIRYFCAVKQDVKKSSKFTHTINLPKTKFPNHLKAQKREEIEKKLIEGTFSQTYGYQDQHKKDPPFVLHDGPPYANGDLHMGHAVNKILKDITLRQRVARGQKVNYIPGWDCHGLPIEMKALSEPGQNSKKHSVAYIREKSRLFAENAVKRQRDELRSWGVMADWQNSNGVYLTYSPAFIKNQIKLFMDLYKKGLIYRDLKPVYWSPSSRTALAEAELEYHPSFVSPSVFIRLELTKIGNKLKSFLSSSDGGNIYAIVWTTTPWTLPSNQAICYNEDLDYSIVSLNNGKNTENEYYLLATNLIDDFEKLTNITVRSLKTIKGTDLETCKYQHPIYKNLKTMPFFAADHVQDSKGTGLVHTAPAHGQDDFLISIAKKLPVISYVDENGFYTENAPHFLRGREVQKDGDSLVMDHISTDIVFSGKYTHSYPIDWRTKKPVIMRASLQWFINTEQLKETAEKEINTIKIYPRINSAACKNMLITQIKKRPYWCISRQRVWGVPIPVFYKRDTKEVIINEKIIDHICKLIDEKGSIDFWWSTPVDKLLPQGVLNNLKGVEIGTDIFDIWFDAGSSWMSVLKNEKVADLYLEGTDQFSGWFQSSLLLSIAARNRAPYRSLFVHGFAVDQNGFKMSKSLGNVVSPQEVRKKFGIDALRWWVASHGTQNMSITVSDNLLQQAANSLSKIRSTLRYLNGVIESKVDCREQCMETEIHLNKYMLSCLFDFEQEVQTLYDAYEYNRVVAKIQHFVSNSISATYVNLIKDRLYCGDKKDLSNIRYTLTKCYEVLCKTLWPITPALVEESWNFYDTNQAFHEETVNSNASWKNPNIEETVECALNLRHLINQKAPMVNMWSLDATVSIKSDHELGTLLRLHPQIGISLNNSELCEILQVGRLKILNASKMNIEDNYDISLRCIKSNLCPRCRRFSIESTEEICKRCTLVLQCSDNEIVLSTAN